MVFLDAGHGGLDPSGNYTTPVGKEFNHGRGRFHKGSYFYEGVWNRNLVYRVADRLEKLGIPHMVVSHPYLDFSLNYRVDTANWYHQYFQEGIFISTHANASPTHQARGYEIYTSPGKTRADELANLHWYQVKELLGNSIRYRPGSESGEHDKEARFFVLQRTRMPAILIEHLFFDNYEDALLLMDEEVVERFAEAQVRAILLWQRQNA